MAALMARTVSQNMRSLARTHTSARQPPRQYRRFTASPVEPPQRCVLHRHAAPRRIQCPQSPRSARTYLPTHARYGLEQQHWLRSRRFGYGLEHEPEALLSTRVLAGPIHWVIGAAVRGRCATRCERVVSCSRPSRQPVGHPDAKCRCGSRTSSSAWLGWRRWLLGPREHVVACLRDPVGDTEAVDALADEVTLPKRRGGAVNCGDGTVQLARGSRGRARRVCAWTARRAGWSAHG